MSNRDVTLDASQDYILEEGTAAWITVGRKSVRIAHDDDGELQIKVWPVALEESEELLIVRMP